MAKGKQKLHPALQANADKMKQAASKKSKPVPQKKKLRRRAK